MQVRDVRKAPDSPNPDAQVSLLEERSGDRRLAIWTGREQAFWLALRLEGVEGSRPNLRADRERDPGARRPGARGSHRPAYRHTFYATIVLDGPSELAR